MTKYQWMKLDTASVMFTSLTSDEWGRTFRLSCAIRNGKPNKEVLAKALEDIRPYFPNAFSCLRKGFFWNYQEVVSSAAELRDETSEGLLPVTGKYRGRPNFRIVCYKNRVAIEGSHFLGDGNGMKTFFLALMSRYFDLLDGCETPFTMDTSAEQRNENAFAKYYNPKGKKDAYSPAKAYHFDESCTRKTPEMLFVLMQEKQLLDLSHKYTMTLTEFYAALMIKAVIECAEKMPDKPVTIAVPVNLRRFFPSETVRNFVTQAYITCDVSQLKSTNLEDICEATRGQLKEQLNTENLIKYINKYGSLINNPVLKIVPNFIKQPVLRMMQKNSHRNVTTIFTNLGECVLDDKLSTKIDRLCFVNGDTSKYGLPVTCSCISFNGILTLCFSHTNSDLSWSKACVKLLVENGVDVRVESSDNYGKGNGDRCEDCGVDLPVDYKYCPFCKKEAVSGENKAKNIIHYPFPSDDSVSAVIKPIKNPAKGFGGKFRGYFNM